MQPKGIHVTREGAPPRVLPWGRSEPGTERGVAAVKGDATMEQKGELQEEGVATPKKHTADQSGRPQMTRRKVRAQNKSACN